MRSIRGYLVLEDGAASDDLDSHMARKPRRTALRQSRHGARAEAGGAIWTISASSEIAFHNDMVVPYVGGIVRQGCALSGALFAVGGRSRAATIMNSAPLGVNADM